jgi:IclR family acetate operon transcriptional repressor
MQQGTKSLSAALKLLEYFATEQREWRVTQLAETANLHKSQVSRILRTFENFGFVQKVAGQYQLGRVFTLYASLAKTDRGLVDLARPIMERLRHQTQGTVMLKTREGGETVTIDRVESQHFLRLAYPIGLRLPLNASSSGKVFLAYMSQEERNRIYRAGYFRRFTARTKTKLAALESDVSAVLCRGFAVSDEEHLLGARGVAAPIFGPGGNLEATLGLGLPKILLPDKRIEETGTNVREAALDISLLLGYRRRSNSNNGKKQIEFTERTNRGGQHKKRG